MAVRLLAAAPAPSRWRRAERGPRALPSTGARGAEWYGFEFFAGLVGRPGQGPRRDGRAGTSRKADPLWWARGPVECRHATFADGYGLSKKGTAISLRTYVL